MRIGIIGRGEILLKCAQRFHDLGHEIPLVITAKEAPEYKVTREDFRQFADKVGAKYAQTAQIDSQDIYDMLSTSHPMDVAVSINYSGVISEKVMSFFNLGILNAHGGDLPRYRGNACQAWAIINGENKIGLCIHKMIGGELDSGDIVEKKLYPITIDTRIGEVYEWFERDIPQMMVNALNKLADDQTFVPEVQSKNSDDILRCYPRIPDDGKIKWEQSAIQILRLINASSEPYDGAFTYLGEKKIKIWRASIFNHHEQYLAVPGQIASIDKNQGFVLVITGNGMLSITDIEVDDWRGNPSNYFKSIRTRLK